MSKTISVSDEVYERLEQEKGERSFSEAIEEILDNRTRLMDVTGNRVVEQESMKHVTQVLTNHNGST